MKCQREAPAAAQAISRRTFVRSVTASAIVGALGARVASAADAEFSASRYAAAIVIDGLGGPGEFAPDATDDSWSARVLADVKASGFTAVNVTVGAVGNGPRQFEETVSEIAHCDGEVAAHPDVFLKALSVADIQRAKTSGRLALIYGFQDTSMLDGQLERVSLFKNLGVRIVQLTYNRRNLMGDGCLEAADGGLSSLGRELISELDRLQLLLDLSHAGPRTIIEGIGASKGPLAITHTGCRALVDVPRNVHDTVLKALAEKGGVAGIYFMPFLRSAGQPRKDDLIRHLQHAVNVCGEDHVGLGTDGYISGIELDDRYAAEQRQFYEERKKAGIAAPGEAADVFNLIPEYNSPRRFAMLADDLSRQGWRSGRIEKVLGANFARLFKDAWGG